MGFGRFLKKRAIDTVVPFGYVARIAARVIDKNENIVDAVKNDFKETVCEDAPVTSHIYKAGQHDGEREGRAKQSKTDSQKYDEMNKKHQEDAKRWEESDKAKDEHIKRQADHIKEQDEVIDGLSQK